MSKGMFKFEMIFHSLLMVFAIGIIIAYMMSGVQIFYIILGALIAVNSVIRMIRAIDKRSKSQSYE